MFCEANDQLLVFFLSKIFLTKVAPSRRDVMFIEHESPKDLLASAERNGLAYHCRKHRAPLEPRSCSQTVSINIWLRWSQNANFGCGPGRAVNSCDAFGRKFRPAGPPALGPTV